MTTHDERRKAMLGNLRAWGSGFGQALRRIVEAGVPFEKEYTITLTAREIVYLRNIVRIGNARIEKLQDEKVWEPVGVAPNDQDTIAGERLYTVRIRPS